LQRGKGGEEGEERELRPLLLNGGVQVAAYNGNGGGQTGNESGGRLKRQR
jgi:hypothetical protein